jgi:hypothetical protein
MVHGRRPRVARERIIRTSSGGFDAFGTEDDAFRTRGFTHPFCPESKTFTTRMSSVKQEFRIIPQSFLCFAQNQEFRLSPSRLHTGSAVVRQLLAAEEVVGTLASVDLAAAIRKLASVALKARRQNELSSFFNPDAHGSLRQSDAAIYQPHAEAVSRPS